MISARDSLEPSRVNCALAVGQVLPFAVLIHCDDFIASLPIQFLHITPVMAVRLESRDCVSLGIA